MFILVRLVFFCFVELVKHFPFIVGNVSSVTEYFSFCTDQHFVHLAHCAFLMAALAVQYGAICITKFNKMMVENFTIIFSNPHFSSAHTLCTYGISTVSYTHLTLP